jgi:DNA modification methylase/transcriptional regulator with XRE-family HTH domain
MRIINGDCLDVLKELEDNSVDSIVTDPPYGLSFMGKRWDYDVPSVEVWAECLRVLKPGGHLLAFAGTRTQHRMAVRIEDAGFEIRDMIAWVYGSGFPKSLDVSKAIDKRGGAQVAWFGPWFRQWRKLNGITQKEVSALFPSKTGGLTGCVANWELGFNMPTPEQFNLIRDRFDLPFTSIEEAEREVVGQKTAGMGSGETFGMLQAEGRNSEATKVVDITAPATPEAKQWQGWGTALKPALEPITVARKPLIGTVAENVLQHGTGAINVDGCRVEGVGAMKWEKPRGGIWSTDSSAKAALVQNEQGRWPANLIHNGSEEVVGLFPQSKSTGGQASLGAFRNGDVYGKGRDEREIRDPGYGDSGSAARFFYCAKASKADRGEGNNHPTVKPTDLMRYLCRLVTPPKGIVLDPFMGSGSTGKGAILEGFDFIGIEREEEYCKIAEQRIGVVVNNFW